MDLHPYGPGLSVQSGCHCIWPLEGAPNLQTTVEAKKKSLPIFADIDWVSFIKGKKKIKGKFFLFQKSTEIYLQYILFADSKPQVRLGSGN